MEGIKKIETKKDIKCKNCGRSFKLFLAHLAKMKDCQKSYGEEYSRLVKIKAKEKLSRNKEYIEKTKKKFKSNKLFTKLKIKDKFKSNEPLTGLKIKSQFRSMNLPTG